MPSVSLLVYPRTLFCISEGLIWEAGLGQSHCSLHNTADSAADMKSHLNTVPFLSV